MRPEQPYITPGPAQAMPSPPPSRDDHGWRALAKVGLWMLGVSKEQAFPASPERHQANAERLALLWSDAVGLTNQEATRRLSAEPAPADGWVRVEDGLPEIQDDDDSVLVFTWDGELVDEDEFVQLPVGSPRFTGGKRRPITHWMYRRLPAPPVVEGGKP